MTMRNQGCRSATQVGHTHVVLIVKPKQRELDPSQEVTFTHAAHSTRGCDTALFRMATYVYIMLVIVYHFEHARGDHAHL